MCRAAMDKLAFPEADAVRMAIWTLATRSASPLMEQ